MLSQRQAPAERRKHDPTLDERYRTGNPKPVPKGTFRSLRLGLITGASDDDPSAIGTYAAAGGFAGPLVFVDHSRNLPHDVFRRLLFETRTGRRRLCTKWRQDH